MNILISSAGRRVILVKEFKKALRKLKIKGKVMAIDVSNTAPALYEADKGFVVPRVNDRDFLAALFSIVKEEKVDLIIPTIDPELPVYARVRDELRQATGARVVVSPAEVVETCTDKYQFFQFLKSISISTPHTYLAEDLIGKSPHFPLFAKPKCGFASINTYKIEDRMELQFLLNKFPELIFQEYIDGREYTIDLLSDFEGKVISVVPRERIEVRAGEVTRSRTEKNKNIIAASKKIAEKLGCVGPITLQCLLRENIPYFFEVNPRVGGGLPASIAAGANTPLNLIKLCQGKILRPAIGRFKDNHYMLRFDDAVYRSSLIAGGIDIWRKR